MRLYLAQHARALTEEQDITRSLSAAGREDARRVAEALRLAGVGLWRIRHSGKARARQTAEIMAATLPVYDGMEAMAGLGPSDAITGVIPDIAGWAGDVMLVSHMPFVARLAGYLLAGGTEPGPMLAFEPGTVACLDRTAVGEWRLDWMLRPELT